MEHDATGSSSAGVPRALLCVGAGLLGGVASGLLGIGGGVLLIPLLVFVMTQHQAHATSLAAIIPTAAVGASVFALQDDVGISIAIALAAGALVGAPLGARAMARLSDRKLQLVFTTLQVIVGTYLLVS